MIKSERRTTGRKTLRIRTINEEPTKTQQQFQKDVDVNNIMKKYQRTREITHLNNRKGVYANISTAEGYFESLNKIETANQAFDQLPSHIRVRFHNNPAELLQFIHDPKNYDEGVKLGIFDPKQPAPGQKEKTPAPTPNDDPNDEPIPSSKPKR